jgi:Glycosyl transferase family 2
MPSFYAKKMAEHGFVASAPSHMIAVDSSDAPYIERGDVMMLDSDSVSRLGFERIRRSLWRVRQFPFLMYGVLFCSFSILMYLFGVFMVFPRYFMGINRILLPLNAWIVWNSGIPLILGFVLASVDLFIFDPMKRPRVRASFAPIVDPMVTVALTAYNDELSIADAVSDFLAHPSVRSVLVISNNSEDGTIAAARAAGAVVFNESRQGYGYCVHRCLAEAVAHDSTDLIVLCEGDMTFRAQDIEKLLAYASHADIVMGTRTVEGLRQYATQLSTFMYFGNWFVGKLLEAKHLGKATITDVGTTYKLCRRGALVDLLEVLDPRVNLEFNAYFMDIALARDYTVLECPITFHPRVGDSKGGNINNYRALVVGCRMIVGIVFGHWRRTR